MDKSTDVKTLDNAALLAYATLVNQHVVGDKEDETGIAVTGRLLGCGPTLMAINAELISRWIELLPRDDVQKAHAIIKTYKLQYKS